MKLVLTRKQSLEDRTLGYIEIPDDYQEKLFRTPKEYPHPHEMVPDGKKVLYTLELLWQENKRDVSCIPNGDYQCENDDHGKFRTAKIVEVDGRASIEFHVGNTPKNTRGCILLGMGIIGNSLYQSRLACKLFKRLITFAPDGKFMLAVQSADEFADADANVNVNA